MVHYNISPMKGWVSDGKNIEIAEHLYNTLMPLVNSDDWNYYNFMSGQGWFEQENCGSLFVDFIKSDDEDAEIEFIKSLQLSLIKSNSDIHKKVLQISKEYELTWSCTDDS